jgi:tetratricopeptide (TPR) repeat protein
MAQSLKISMCLLLSLALVGCGLVPRRASTPRLSYVLTLQEQADTAYRTDDMQRAAALYLQLTKLIPQEADYWYMLGNSYVRTQQPDRAVEAYQQAIARNPNHTRAWHNLGIVRMRQAMAAFVSSASTAKQGDPLRDVSTRLADDLARIGTAGSPIPNPPRTAAAGAAAKPWSSGPEFARRKPGTSTGVDPR